MLREMERKLRQAFEPRLGRRKFRSPLDLLTGCSHSMVRRSGSRCPGRNAELASRQEQSETRCEVLSLLRDKPGPGRCQYNESLFSHGRA